MTTSSGVSALSPSHAGLSLSAGDLPVPVCDNIIGDLLAFVEVPHPGALDSAHVNEHLGVPPPVG